MIGTKRYGAGFAVIALAASITASCGAPSKRLSAPDRRTCVAQGGYESRSAFGFPICQFRYGDGGKSCSDKKDCQGECRLSVDGELTRIPRPGEAVTGLCQPTSYSPGCFVTIEDGEVTDEGAVCED